MNPLLAIGLITWLAVVAMIAAGAGDAVASFVGMFEHLQAPK